MPRFRRKNNSKELPAEPPNASAADELSADEPHFEQPHKPGPREEQLNREQVERRAAVSADPDLPKKEYLDELQARIDEKRENLKHAPTTSSRRAAERNLERLEDEHSELFGQVYRPIEGCAFGDDGKYDPDGPLFPPITCSKSDCDGLIPDGPTAFDQLGLCAPCHDAYQNPKPKRLPRRFNV